MDPKSIHMGPPSGPGTVAATAGLLEALCELAADRDPEPVAVPLAVTAAPDLDIDHSPEVPLFTHFYLPDTGRSVRAVFGIDLGVPAGTTPGIFLSHPDGRRTITKRDELREVILVAVPPWKPGAVTAHDRRGRRRSLRRHDVTLPEESLP